MNKLPLPGPLSKTGLFYLSPIEVLNDGQMETLLALPLCLHGVVEKLPEGPIRPFQQLIVEQECVGSLCKANHSMALTNNKHKKQTKYTEMGMLFLRGTFLMGNWFILSIRQTGVVVLDRVTIYSYNKNSFKFSHSILIGVTGTLLASQNTKETEIK